MQVEKQTACCIHGLRNDTKAVKTGDYRTTRKFKVVTCLSSRLPVGIEEEASCPKQLLMTMVCWMAVK